MANVTRDFILPPLRFVKAQGRALMVAQEPVEEDNDAQQDHGEKDRAGAGEAFFHTPPLSCLEWIFRYYTIIVRLQSMTEINYL